MKMTEVFKVSTEIKDKMIDYYNDKKRPKTPPYAFFQAEEAGTVVTLYTSGKAMFQGPTADIDANMWKGTSANIVEEIETELFKDELLEQTDFYHTSSIGSDEVGTGDFFGPIVVTAAFVKKEDIKFLEALGIKDSKKLTDEKILKMVPQFMKKINYESIILSNTEYNETHSFNNNMNKIKAIMHNKMLYKLKKQIQNYDYIIVDQFAKEKKYYEYLKDSKELVKNITFLTKGEDKSIAVAAASLISRYLFVKEFDKLSDSVGIPLPKGAGFAVDKIGKEFVEKYGFEKLKDVAKMNFKNVQKIKDNL